MLLLKILHALNLSAFDIALATLLTQVTEKKTKNKKYNSDHFIHLDFSLSLSLDCVELLQQAEAASLRSTCVMFCGLEY